MVVLRFAAGTLELQGLGPEQTAPSSEFDPRTLSHRAPARAYAEIVLWLRKSGLAYDDQARAYGELEPKLALERAARPFQQEALVEFRKAGGRGVVVLPTGAGKSHVAVLAIDDRRRSALVVVPTLDLVRQWYDLLRTTFATEVGIVGGGSYELRPLTVTTYDSAYLHMQNFGARFGTVVFDECHHLPGASYELAAEFCLAPFRLGLTATPERSDGREATLARLIGPVVYRRDIVELAGEYLAEYVTERVNIELTPEEREEYDIARKIYVDFLRASGVRLGSPSGWSDFLMRASRSEAGLRALAAYRRQRELALASGQKLECLASLLARHRTDRVLVFTDDNATAYAISRRFLVPVITHQTKVRERSEILQKFSSGEYGVVTTSRVLNEGVDVPEARVAIVISGSGSVREHVQRLGRILRRREGKQAILYELVSSGTGEGSTSERRRAHSAYRSAGARTSDAES